MFPPLSVLITPRYREALASAEDRHRDQRRKGKAVPYISHLDGLLSFLTKAARTSWELPTAQVQLLVGAKPLVSTFSRYGCSVRPSGRHGRETSWRMER